MSKELQGELAILGQLTNELRELDSRLVAMCDTLQASYRLCVNQSKVHRTHANIADLLGKTESEFNTIINNDRSERTRHLGRIGEIQLQRICQNTAIDQWADLYSKGLLNSQRSAEEQLADLERRAAELKAQLGVA